MKLHAFSKNIDKEDKLILSKSLMTNKEASNIIFNTLIQGNIV